MAGAERIFATLALAPETRPAERRRTGRDAVASRSVTSCSDTPRASRCCTACRCGRARRARRAGGTNRRREDQRAPAARRASTRRGRARVRIAGRDPARLDESERNAPGRGASGGAAVLRNGLRQPHARGRVGPRGRRVRSGQDRGCRRVHPRTAAGLSRPCSAGRAGQGAQLSAGPAAAARAGARARRTGRRCSCWTKRPPRSTVSATPRFGRRCAQWVLPRGCAVLTVAHRLSTAIEADRVVVLEKGRIVEEGAPGELARAGPLRRAARAGGRRLGLAQQRVVLLNSLGPSTGRER